MVIVKNRKQNLNGKLLKVVPYLKIIDREWVNLINWETRIVLTGKD